MDKVLRDLLIGALAFIAGVVLAGISQTVGDVAAGIVALPVLTFVYLKYYRPYRRAKRAKRLKNEQTNR